MVFVSWWLRVWQRCSKGFSGAFRRAGGCAGSAVDTEVSYVNIYGKKHAGRWKWSFTGGNLLENKFCCQLMQCLCQMCTTCPKRWTLSLHLSYYSVKTCSSPHWPLATGPGVRYTQCGCLHERGPFADGQEQLLWSLELTWGARGLMHSLRLELSPRLKAGKGETSESGGGGTRGSCPLPSSFTSQ